MTDQYTAYVSTKCAADCVQTLFLCVPDAYSTSEEKAMEFAKASGWIEQAEDNGALLIMLLATEGWATCSRDALFDFYQRHKNDFRSRSGHSIPGRDGFLWLWETMIYAIGVEEGADYLASALIKHPNFFAGAVLINGATDDFKASKLASDHWLVSKPSSDYAVRNMDVPVPVWLLGHSVKTEPSLKHFLKINRVDQFDAYTVNDIKIDVYFNSKEPAHHVRTSLNASGHEMLLAKTVMDEFINVCIRWKNSPDGTLKLYSGKKGYYHSSRFIHHELTLGELVYPYSVHLPLGMTPKSAKGLPLVISLHGRGEPTWVFAEKNGWDKLADETQAFIVIFPDSKDNIWSIERDAHALEAILLDLSKTINYDPERVYLTGFSNGAIYTCQQASTYPWLFAAASPWNGPDMSLCLREKIASYVYHPDFIRSGYEMPFWIIVGDNDTKAGPDRQDELEILCQVNHCSKDQNESLEKVYTPERHYENGDRFQTKVIRNDQSSIRIGLTVMKNMPHGAIFDESRATWEFMKRFRRPHNSKTVEEDHNV